MTCRLGTDKDGNRFIACTRRGSRRLDEPRLRFKADAIADRSPWVVGATVDHDRYGEGTITERDAVYVTVFFPAATGGERQFKLALVGKAMRVLA